MSRGELLGGDTPFFSNADMKLIDAGHKPISVKVDGKEATRIVFVDMCGIMWGIALEEPFAYPHEQFMREYIAGANHDLRAQGLGPLISLEEARLRYEEIKKTDTDGKVFRPKGDGK